MKKIYDGFTFFNELDVLDIRLEELYDHVDVFVLVESDHTFTNIPKPYHFEENKHRYSKYLDKIRHIKIESQKDTDPWANERFQRECISHGCADAQPEDIVIVSDVDEIPRVSTIDRLRSSHKDIYAVYTPFFVFKLNYLDLLEHKPTTIAAKASIFFKMGPHALRYTRKAFREPPYQYGNYDCDVILQGGWHFTYIGSDHTIQQKLAGFSHASDHTSDMVKNFTVDEHIVYNAGDVRVIVPIDDYFPSAVLNNREKYARYILDELNAGSAYGYLTQL